MEKRNTREDGKEAETYRLIKDRIAIPVEHLERVYATKYARHFFSSETREQWIRKWSKTS